MEEMCKEKSDLFINIVGFFLHSDGGNRLNNLPWNSLKFALFCLSELRVNFYFFAGKILII
jgi:hypothetical protein